jgi:hypothetical protein
MPKQKGYPDDGMGGTTKYGAENAPVIKNGGNQAIHDHVVSSGPQMGNNKGTDSPLRKAKGMNG